MSRHRLGRRERAIVRAQVARVEREGSPVVNYPGLRFGGYATAKMAPHGKQPNHWEYNGKTALRINRQGIRTS
jgi:hypothetical protein